MYEGLLKGAWVTQSSCIIEKSTSAWATIMKANSLKLPGQHVSSSLEEPPFPRKAIGQIVLGEKVLFIL